MRSRQARRQDWQRERAKRKDRMRGRSASEKHLLSPVILSEAKNLRSSEAEFTLNELRRFFASLRMTAKRARDDSRTPSRGLEGLRASFDVAEPLQAFPHLFFSVIRLRARPQDGRDFSFQNVDDELIRGRVAGFHGALLHFLQQIIIQLNSMSKHRPAPFSPCYGWTASSDLNKDCPTMFLGLAMPYSPRSVGAISVRAGVCISIRLLLSSTPGTSV